MGVTTIIPDMDPTRPADVNPQRLVEAATQWEVDQAFGSPALWNTVVRWADANNHSNDRFRRCDEFSRPARRFPPSRCEKLRTLVDPEANIVTPYGATEALADRFDRVTRDHRRNGPAAAKGKGDLRRHTIRGSRSGE